ncbi:MAG: hypothetical protein WCF85_00480 [Rhodospirillaceae bacterium]
MAIRFVCTVVILLAEFYAWLMTATGLQLTQYRPAFGGWIGNAQPFVLAGLVHAAISLFYLRLASPVTMTRREKIALATSVPLILIFVLWSIFMSSYSIMFERRSETSFTEAGNKLQSIAEKLHAIDTDMTSNYNGVINNLRDRMELEIRKPEPGVVAGCGNRCRTLRRGWTALQDFQYLSAAVLRDRVTTNDLAKELSLLENEFIAVNDRLEGFRAASRVFIEMNRIISGGIGDAVQEDLSGGNDGTHQAAQYNTRLKEMKRQLDDLRTNDRKLTDDKYRGLTELVKDLNAAFEHGRVAQMLDLLTILLIAMAPDILCLAMAALARSFTKNSEAAPMLPWGHMFWRRLLRNRRYMPSGMEIDNLKNLVTEQLRYRVSGGAGDAPIGPGGAPAAPGPGQGPSMAGSGGPSASEMNPLLQGLRPHRRPAAREPIIR